MKAVFFLPAHPSYFDPKENYSQDEIEEALRQYDRFMGGKLFKGDPDPKVKEEYRLLREAGKSIQVVLDSSGLGDGTAVADAEKEYGLAQYRRTSSEGLQIHVNNIKEHLKMLRMGYFDKGKGPTDEGESSSRF